VSSSLKYQNEGGPAPADIARVMRAAMPPAVADQAVWRFADALISNCLIGGTDAHAENYSLLLAGDQVRLAPLYDIASALPYGVHERKLRFAMKIGTSYELFPRRNTWPGAVRDLGLDPHAVVERAGELARIAPVASADAVRLPAVAAPGRNAARQAPRPGCRPRRALPTAAA
jgi:serine/threonine-protein kinase HipA